MKIVIVFAAVLLLSSCGKNDDVIPMMNIVDSIQAHLEMRADTMIISADTMRPVSSQSR